MTLLSIPPKEERRRRRPPLTAGADAAAGRDEVVVRLSPRDPAEGQDLLEAGMVAQGSLAFDTKRVPTGACRDGLHRGRERPLMSR